MVMSKSVWDRGLELTDRYIGTFEGWEFWQTGNVGRWDFAFFRLLE